MTTPDFEATADAFGVLADPIRVETLTALWQADETPLPYSRLRDAVGVRDSGRFSYHLGKLTDDFVQKDGGGYRLTTAGMVVMNAVYAGSYVDAPSREDVPVPGTCPDCGGGLVGEYDAGMFRVDCADCDTLAFMLSFPPRGVEQRGDDALVRSLSLHARAHARRLQGGLCPFCGGVMETALQLDADTDLPASTLVRSECTNCGVENRASVGFALLEHPAVAGFLHEQGVPADAPPWRFDWCVSDDAVTVLARDPPRVRLSVTAGDGDEALHVVVDERGCVDGVERADA